MSKKNGVEKGKRRKSPTQKLLSDLMILSRLTLKQIALNTRIPLCDLSRINCGRVASPEPKTFSRLLNFYCIFSYINQFNRKEF